MKPWELRCNRCDNIIFNGECCYVGISCKCGGSYEKEKIMTEKLTCSNCKNRFYNVDFKFCPYDGTPIKWIKDNE